MQEDHHVFSLIQVSSLAAKISLNHEENETESETRIRGTADELSKLAQNLFSSLNRLLAIQT